MRGRVLLLSALLVGSSSLAWAVPQQASNPATVPHDTAGPPPQNLSKQVGAAISPAPASDASKKGAKTPRTIHFQLGSVSFGAGYSYFSVRYYYPYGPLGFNPYGVGCPGFLCGPFWYDYPYFASPVYLGSLAHAEDKGQVRLMADPRTAEVYIDGAYAGTADHLKTMWLDSGAYDLSFSAHGYAPFYQRIYVLSGKSLKISAKLEPEEAPSPAGHETEGKP